MSSINNFENSINNTTPSTTPTTPVTPSSIDNFESTFDVTKQRKWSSPINEQQQTETTNQDVVNFKNYNVDQRFGNSDWQEQLAQNQTWSEKTWHGTERLVGQTVAKVGEGVGYVGGFVDYGIHGFDDVSRMTDNGFTAAFTSMENAVKEGAPVFVPPSISEGNVLNKFGSWSYWMDSGVDSVAFLASAILPGMALSKIGLGVKVAALLSEESAIAKLAGGATKFASGFDTAAITTYNTISEAAAEAKGVQDQIRAYYKPQIDAGTISEAQVEEKAAKAASSTFNWNSLILLGPNLIQTKLLFGSPTESSVIKRMFDPKTNKMLPNAGRLTKMEIGKELLKEAGLGFVREGLFEENIQTSIQNYEQNFAEGKTKDENAVKNILGGMYDNLFTNEGQESILLGGLIGLVSGGAGGVIQSNRKNAIIDGAQKFMTNHIGSYTDALNNTVKEAFETNEDGSPKLDDNGTPIPNIEAVSKILATLAQKGQIEATKTNALLSGNKDLYEHIKNNEFTAFALPFLQHEGGLDVLNGQIDALAEKELEVSQKTEEVFGGKKVEVENLKAEYKAKAKSIYDSYQSIRQRTGIWDFTESSKEAKSFDAWMSTHQQNLALLSSQAEFFRNKAADTFKEVMKTATGSENFQMGDVADVLTVEEKERLKTLKSKQESYQKLFEESNKEYKKLSSKEESQKLYKKAVEESKVVEEKVTEVKKKEEEIKATTNEKVKSTVNKIQEIDDAIENIDNQMEMFGADATQEDLDDLAAQRKELVAKKEALSSEEGTKTREESVSHINQHSLKEGETVLFKGNKVTLQSIDPNKGTATIDNGKSSFTVPIKEVSKFTEVVGDVNENTSAKMTEESETDIKKPLTEKLDGNIASVNPGRTNVIMNSQFTSEVKKDKFGIRVFKWLRDSLGFPKKEDNINGFDYKYINDSTSLLPGSTIDYKIVEPNEAQKKVFKTGEQAIGIYQNDKLVGFVASPKPVDESDSDKDRVKRLLAERDLLVAHRQLILEKLNNKEVVTTTISDKGTGNYIAITKDGHGKFTDNDGKVISIFDREIREQDKVDGNPVFVFVRNGFLEVPLIEKSNTLNGDDYINTLAKIKSDLSDLNKNGNKYASVEGQTFMLVKAANGKWAPIPVYSAYQNEDTVNKIVSIIVENVATTDHIRLISDLNPYIFAGAAVERKVRIYQDTDLENNPIIRVSLYDSNGQLKIYSLDQIKNNATLRENFKQDLLAQRQNIFAQDLNTSEGQERIKTNRSITTNVVMDNGDYFVQPYVQYKSILPESKIESINNSAPIKNESAAGDNSVESFNALFDTKSPVREADATSPTTSNTNPTVAEIEKRRQEELDKNTKNINTTDVRRPNGGIGTQGFDPSQMKDLVSFLNDKLGLNIPKNLLDKNNDSLKPLIDFIKDNNLTNKIIDYVKSNPSEIITLPDGTIEFKDGNHRANLLNILGSEILPTIDQDLSKEINAKYDEELAALENESFEAGTFTVWHGSDENITEFKNEFPEGYFTTQKGGSPKAIFFSKDKAPLESVYGTRKFQKQFKVTMKNPLVVDGKKGYTREKEGFKDLINRAIKNGHDGVIIKNIHDNFNTDVYVSLDSKNIKPLTESKPTVTNQETKANDVLNKLAEFEDDADPFKAKDSANKEVENIKQVKAWFKKNLPQFPHTFVDELFKADGTRAEAWGVFQNNIVKVINGAPEGTSYHEAFHAVFRSLLSDSEKVELIQEAITKYGIPTLEELDKLNELYNGKLNDEQLNWLFYEEKLADDHAEYTKSFEPKGFFGKIKEFFEKIWNFFNFFKSVSPNKAEQLFKKINTGKFAKSNPKVANVSRAIAELSTVPAYRAIDDGTGKYFTAAYKLQRVTSIANKFMAEFQRLQSSGVDSSKISAISIYEGIYNDYLKVAEDMVDNPTKYSKSVKGNMSKFLKPYVFNQFKAEANKMLAAMKIKVKDKVEFEEQDFSKEEGDDKLSEEIEDAAVVGNVTKGLSEHIYQSGLSHASTRLKMFVSSIPVRFANGKVKTDDFGDVVYHDFNPLYYYIEANLIGLNTLEDQLQELKSLTRMRPELKTVIERLTERQPNQSEADFQRLRDDFTSNFSKQHLGYTLVMSSVNNSTGNVDITILDANRQTVGREVFNDWNNNLLKTEKNTISEIKEGVVVTNGTKKAEKAYADWMELIKDKNNMTFNKVNNMLLKIGIEYSPETLEDILSQNDNNFIVEVSHMFQYYAYDKITAEKNRRNAMKSQMALVGYEVKHQLNRYSPSFQNGLKKNIWSIQLPSFASKLVTKLTSSNKDVYKKELNELLADSSNQYSNLIEKFKDLNFRTNVFKINYLDSLKDKKGNGLGTSFINMNSKDYMIMSIGLFNNKLTNQNRKSTEDINKIIYIPPSDKSMAMIVDMNSYGVKVNKQGKLDRESEIVTKYYNTVKMEINRISEQLKVEDKVKSGELKKEDLLLHYHYSKNNKSFFEETDPAKFKADGFAYQFNEITSLNKEILSTLKESLKTAEYSEVEDIFKSKILDAIVEELNNEIAGVVEEAIEKKIIAKDETTGELINIALDPGTKSMQSILEQSHTVYQTLANFALNQRLSYLELSNLFNGDIAMYKAGDLQKRTYQSQAMGVNIVAAADEVVKTMLVKDVELEADYLNKGNEHFNSWISTLVNDLGYSEAKAKKMLSKYEKTNVTDATVFISPSLFKKMNKRIWTDKMENAFNIAEGITKNPTKQQIEDSIRVLSGVKPFGYGRRFDSKLGINVHEQVKTFFVPLFKSFVKGNDLLTRQRESMDSSGVEMLATESAFKAAIGYRFDINTLTADQYKNHSFDFKLENLSVQVDNPNHSFEEDNDSLRQLKMIMVGVIDESKTYSGKSGKDLLSVIDSMESTNIEADLKYIMSNMTSLNNDFKKEMKEALTKRGSTENMEKMLEIVDGEWRHPLNSGTHEIPVQNMLSSHITNNAIKQPFAGGSLVNTTGLGVDSSKFLRQSVIDKNPYLKDLQSKLQHVRQNKATGVIEHAQCILPAYMKAFYNEDNSLKNLSDIPENLKELLLYRIPSEFLHSALPSKVVGFLPEHMGNYVLLPYDVTTQMGLDFDFDKLYFIRPEYSTEKGKSTKVEYDYSKSASENTREARNNRIFDTYMTLLRSKENFDKLIAPSDFYELQKNKTKIEKESEQNSKRSFFSGITQRELKDRNHIALALKAMTSLEVTGHSYATKMNLSIAAANKIVFNGAKDEETTNLSNINNKEGQNIAQLLYKVQAAVMDDVKNPLLDTLGINKNTIGIFSAILRTGYSLETAINFITQPSIVELSKGLDSNVEKTRIQSSGRVSIDGLKTNYINKYQTVKALLSVDRQRALSQEEAYYIGNEETTPTHNLIDKAAEGEKDQRKWGMENWRKFAKDVDVNNLSKENIEANPLIADYYLYQAKVLYNYGRYDTVGQGLTKLNRFFAINTKIGPNVENINDQIYNRDEIFDLENDSFVIQGIAAGLKNLKALDSYNNVLTETYDYMKKEFPYATAPIEEVKQSIVSAQIDYRNPIINKITQDKRMKINGFIASYLDRKLEIFKDLNNPEEQRRLMIDFTKQISDIKSLKNEQYAGLRTNLFIDTITVNWTLAGEEGVKFISTKGNKLEPNIQDNISEAFYSLYKNPETKQLAIDFVKYSVLSSGLYSGINSYHHLISPEVLVDLGYSDHRKQMNVDLNNNVDNLISKADKEILKDRIIRNFASDFTKVASDKAFIILGNNTISTDYMKVLENNQTYAMLTAKPTKESPAKFVEYVQVFMDDTKKLELYQNITKPGESIQTYKRISYLGQKARFIEMVVGENNESLIPTNNYDYTVAARENDSEGVSGDDFLRQMGIEESSSEGEDQSTVDQALETKLDTEIEKFKSEDEDPGMEADAFFGGDNSNQADLEEYDPTIKKTIIESNIVVEQNAADTLLAENKVQKKQIKGVEISSNSMGLAAALTNPTALASAKGNLAQDYPVEFRGKKYKDAEQAYQDQKRTATFDAGTNSTYNLMKEILIEKLKQYPRLVTEINKNGGSEWILNSTHQPTNKNTVWETGGKNWFIKALNEAYLTINPETNDDIEKLCN